MEKHSSGSPDKTIWVAEWQAGLSESYNSVDYGLVSRVYSECIAACKSVTQNSGIWKQHYPKEISRRLERSISIFAVWGLDHGMETGEIESVVSESSVLRQSIVEIMSSLGRTIVDGLTTLLISEKEFDSGPLRSVLQECDACLRSEFPEDWTEFDDAEKTLSNEGTGAEELEETIKDLETDLSCLLDLEILIESSSRNQSINLTSEMIKDGVQAPHEVYSNLIKYRYPNADERLIDELGKANWNRFLRNKLEREKNLQINHLGEVGREALLLNADADANADANNATIVDSGYGTLDKATCSYAETIMSYHIGEHQIQVPKLHKAALDGDVFECLCCGERLRITSTKRWKAHLMKDLRPWTCVEVTCDSLGVVFHDRKSWVDHYSRDHSEKWRSRRCPLCRTEIGEGQPGILAHLLAHLEEISLGSLPAHEDGDAAGPTDESTKGETKAPDLTAIPWVCHFCLKRETRGPPGSTVYCSGCSKPVCHKRCLVPQMAARCIDCERDPKLPHVIQQLAKRAAADRSLRTMMEQIAMSRGTKESLVEFQAIIDRIREDVVLDGKHLDEPGTGVGIRPPSEFACNLPGCQYRPRGKPENYRRYLMQHMKRHHREK